MDKICRDLHMFPGAARPIDAAVTEIDRLRAELAEARRALLAGNDTVLANKKLQERVAHERVEGDKILAALEMANARIVELEAAGNRLGSAAITGILDGNDFRARAERADARIAELEAWKATCQEVDCYRVSDARAERANARIAELEATRLHLTGEVARLTQNSCDDQDRAEHAEAECKALRETVRKIRATDNITAVWHIADTARDHSLAGREG